MSGKVEDSLTLSSVDVYELASVIGSQFEKLIDSYGPESVANLMPTVIRVLEHLEELAKFSESEREETVELKFTIERLLAEKKLKAEERVKYEKELEQIEDTWKTDARHQRDRIDHLEEENHRLNLTIRDKIVDAKLQADEENRIHELSSEVSRLQDAVQKQREEMRTLEHDVTRKAAELEVLQTRIDQLTKLNADHHRRASLTRRQAQQLIEDKAELQALLHDRDQEIARIRDRLKRYSRDAASDALASKGGLSNDAFEDNFVPDAQRLSGSEMRDVFRERDELRSQLEAATDELRQYQPDSSTVEEGRTLMNHDELDPPVQGPINREPDEKLFPERFQVPKESGIRKLFNFLLAKPNRPRKKGFERVSGIPRRGSLDSLPNPLLRR